MTLVKDALSNLINGVSQQSPALRLATQCDEAINTYPTVVQGLKKRPPRKLLKNIGQTFSDDTFTHLIDRGTNERYRMFIDDGDLKVFDLSDGSEATVNFPDGKSYLASTDPRAEIKAVTISDYTFVVNTSETVAMSGTKSSARNNEALVFIRAGNYGRTYKITINGTTVAQYRTASSEGGAGPEVVQTVDTHNIAKTLVDGTEYSGASDGTEDVSTYNLNSHLSGASGSFTVARYGNVIHIASSDGSDFSIDTEDGYANEAMYAIKDETQDFSDLPTVGPDGFVIKLFGGEENDQDHYYAQFEKQDANDSGGVWRESPAPDIEIELDAATMPHTLVSNGDGTFDFTEATWDDRVAGDEEVIPQPSFVDGEIATLSFHRNRLVITSNDNVIMSRAGDYFNFWRLSATTLLDDDPIDVSISHDKVSLIRSATPWNNDLLLLSSRTQFILSASKLLTPKTVSLDPKTEFESSDVSPVVSGRFVYFPTDRGTKSIVQEYYLKDEFEGAFDSRPVTAHVPDYISSGIDTMDVSNNESMLLVFSPNDPSTLYAYNYYYSEDGEKLQSAWHKWTLEDNTQILGFDIVSSTVHMAVKYENGDTGLETIPLNPSYSDGDFGFPFMLDRRIDETQLSSISYNSATKRTECTLPYETDATIQAIDADTGMVLAVSNHSDDTFEIDGDVTASSLYIGIQYEKLYRFSQFYVRQDARNGGVIVIQQGRLQLRALFVDFDETHHFTIEVTPEGRNTYTYDFSGLVSGDPQTKTGSVGLHRGTIRVPLGSKNEGLTVEVKNDSAFPSNLTSAAWKGEYMEKARGI